MRTCLGPGERCGNLHTLHIQANQSTVTHTRENRTGLWDWTCSFSLVGNHARSSRSRIGKWQPGDQSCSLPPITVQCHGNAATSIICILSLANNSKVEEMWETAWPPVPKYLALTEKACWLLSKGLEVKTKFSPSAFITSCGRQTYKWPGGIRGKIKKLLKDL